MAQRVVVTKSTPKVERYISKPAEAFQTYELARPTELKYRSIGFGIKQNHYRFSLNDRIDPCREIEVNASPACPIRFDSIEQQKESLADQCLTAAEIEWRRWSCWQMERTAAKQLRKKWA